ncbi:MAG: carboxynorspermidine decarboxylase [Planctomycetota bacterium]|nr:carboxynorspermidine decarboxylase [Planctomycetota bacterium]
MHPIPETPIHDLDWAALPSPCFVVDLRLLERNARLLDRVRRAAGCRILAALKGFAMWPVFPVLRPWLDGCAASGPYEARLAREEFGKEVHTYAPAFSDRDLAESLAVSDHLIFNSPSQLARHLPAVRAYPERREVGIRINPEYAEIEVALYNPCVPGSRLGTIRAEFGDELPPGVDGLHFHVMCEQGADVFARVLAAVERRFGDWLPRVRWLNCGGGHHITRADYDVEALIASIRALRARYPQLTVYLEPGEAIALGTGVLVASVLDVLRNGMAIAVLDVSATAHMPDVLEMPYRPTIHGAAAPGVLPYTYRLGGPTCLAGDVIGDWSFAEPLRVGQRLVFADMAHYTMVKTTMFNGVKHPALATWDGRELRILRQFSYDDYKRRLG